MRAKMCSDEAGSMNSGANSSRRPSMTGSRSPKDLPSTKAPLAKGSTKSGLVALGAAHEEVMRKIDPCEGEGQPLAQF